MRTTVSLDADVQAAVDARRRETGAGLSDVVNDLLRLGLAARQRERPKFVQRTCDMGVRVDVSNVGEVLDLLDDT